MLDVFVDTNLLFHGKWLDELPWDELLGPGPKRIVFARAVQSELDKHKSLGNSRRADRARKVLRALRPLIDGEAPSAPIASKGAPIELVLAGTKRIPRDAHPDLDPNRADDQLVAEALLHLETNPNVVLVSHDSGPILTARHHGLEAKRVPDEWLLPPESDDRDRRIAELESEIREVTKREPRLAVDFLHQEKATTLIELDLPRIAAPGAGATRRWLELIEKQYTRKLPPPTLDEWKGAFTGKAAYEAKQRLDYDADYREFLEECTKAFEALPGTIALSKASFAFEIEVRNEGSVPARGLMVEFDAFGRLLVDRTGRMLKYKLRIPKAPDVPVAFLSTRPSLESFGGLANPMDQVLGRMGRMNRDPLGVCWEDEPRDTKFKRGELRCEEFRHGEAHPISLFGFFWEFPDGDASLKVRVSAANVPKPIERVLKVRVKWVDYDLKQALPLLPGKKELLEMAKEAIESAGPDKVPLILPKTPSDSGSV